MICITWYFDHAHYPVFGIIVYLGNEAQMVTGHYTSPRQHNVELASIFHQMASCYRYLGSEHRFRVMAYDGATRTISNLKDDISVYAPSIKELDKLKGIGVSIARKIQEYLSTGKIKTFEKLKKQVPQGLLELMDINGFGPATIRTLHEKLGITNREEMIEALQSGKLEDLRGFGAKRIENMKRGLKLFKEMHARMLLPEAMEKGNALLKEIKELAGVKDAELAGSLRRKKETVGDIDIVASARRREWKRIVTRFCKLDAVERVIAQGETRASILLKFSRAQVDLRLVEEDEFGAALLYFTGSKEHNIALRSLAKDKGWKLNEYGLFDIASDQRIAGATEKEVYRKLGLEYIPPELREQRGEIEKARERSLPVLVEEEDMKGDIQMHSTWSDGADDIESIARYIMKEFPRYQYIVITDHSPSERVARGLKPGEFKDQFIEIDKVNKKLGREFVKKGVEVDILANGALDLPDELLQEFDWVTASIHSGFSKDNTDRLVKACMNPNVQCIGHPSGRLIGKREPYTVRWEKLFEVAVATGTAIEINAQPDRLDLRDDLVKEAIEKGVTLTVSTDAHALAQFDFMSLGVAVARRGWCKKTNILNTCGWKKLEEFKLRKKRALNKRNERKKVAAPA